MSKKGSAQDAPKKLAKKSQPKKTWVFFGDNKFAQLKFKPLLAPAPKKRNPVEKKKALEKMFDQYFFGLSHKQFTQLAQEWNEVNLKIELKDQKNYDGWLNYFKKIPVAHIKILLTTGEDILGAEGYAALTRWIDIISNPGRIDKIHKAGLTGSPNDKKTITSLAASNDRHGVLCAIRDQLASRLQNNPGNRDTADLSKQLTDVMTQIAVYERRAKGEKSTVLGDLMSERPPEEGVASKRASKSGEGHRRTSFSSRVTIKDVEENE